MLCYKDRTFCVTRGCPKFSTCDRALTPAVQAGAAAWWGSDEAPICVCDFQCEDDDENKVHDLGSGNREP